VWWCGEAGLCMNWRIFDLPWHYALSPEKKRLVMHIVSLVVAEMWRGIIGFLQNT
jgi:hypothetical protein